MKSGPDVLIAGAGPTELTLACGLLANGGALKVQHGECAAVVAKRLGDDGMSTLIADHDAHGELMSVRPDAHLGGRGHADPEALDRWLTAVTRQGRAGGVRP